MADQKNYQSNPFIYESCGLGARWEPDRVPQGYFLNWLNIFERSEKSASSRYGTQIVNRDPYGTPPAAQNYLFSAPATSLARLVYRGSAYRYAGLADGTLWRRTGNSQGPYTQIYSGLSGNPFTTIVASCFETAQAYMFIADAAASIKDRGTGTPQLWGIDPSPYTLNALPYAPLLIMIDNFAATNAYTLTPGITAWSWANIVTLDANSGRLITDFSQFYGIGPAGGGTSNYPGIPGSLYQTASTGTPGTVTTNSGSINSFPSIVPALGDAISFNVTVQGSVLGGGFFRGTINFQWSPDGGTTWYTFYSLTSPYSINETWGPTSVSGGGNISNLDQLQLRIQCVASVFSGDPVGVVVTGQITSCYASIANANAFGPVMNGMLSVLNANKQATVPISSVNSATFLGGLYTQLQVSTSSPHYLSASDTMAIYASSSDLVDGFYQVQQVTASNSFLIPFLSASLIGAEGGYVTYAATSVSASNTASNTYSPNPPACVLTDQYSTPYPSQMTAWGFYEWVPPTTTAFPLGAWSGTIAANSTGSVSATPILDLNQNNQVTDFDLIVLTILASNPENIAQASLQFFVGGSSPSSPINYYQAFISPAYFQGAVAGTTLAYQATQQQILADALGLITGQTPNTTSAQLQPSNFSTGSGSWQACLIPRGNFLPVGQAGQAGLDWANVTGWQLNVTTNTLGGVSFSVNGLYLQWGYGPSSFAGVGYDWRQTYYNSATGTESSPTPIQQYNQDFGYLASTSAPIFLRQAAQVTGLYSADPQVSHVRLYRRGGILASNWLLTVQAPNVAAAGKFVLKDVIGDAFIEQAQPLALDNDPPVTSSLVVPILTALAAPTTGPGQSIYSIFAPQTVVVADPTAQFVVNQVVLVGNANNLEEVLVTAGGTGSFTAVIRLQHNMGEQVSATSIPRQACSLCAVSNQGGVTQVWLAGDPNNPHYLYYSKPGLPENFSPAGYVAVSSPDDPIMAVINWRGTIVVGTTKTWYIIVGGAKPYPQPTGAAHGMASSSWTLVEGEIIYLSQDGLRAFSGADGQYMTLPVEWMFRQSPATIVPKLNASDYASTVLCQYNNQAYFGFQSASDSFSTGNGQRYRLRWDDQYKRFGLDDVPATAMLWEQDTNALLVGVQIPSQPSPSNYAVVQDWVGDYDDGGWNAGGTALLQIPIHLTPQTPFHDLGKPHFPKQWNMLEGDYNTQGQPIYTTLYFNTEPQTSLVLPPANTGNVRSKVQYQIPAVASASNPLASGVQAYAMSIQHDMYVTVAPTLYQENVYAELLADYRTSFDTYWQGTMGDLLGVQPKNGYFDYTATAQLIVQIYADGDDFNPYFVDSRTLIPQANRSVVRVQFPARKGRLWRVIVTSSQPFQLWAPARFEIKALEEGSGYEERAFPVYQ